MKHKNLLTREKYEGRQLTAADISLLNSVETREGLVEITAEQAMEMAQITQKLYEALDKIIRPMMYKKRADYVKQLRVVEKCTWRMVALRCWTAWNGGWKPPTNQLVGMKLCEIAGEILGENIE